MSREGTGSGGRPNGTSQWFGGGVGGEGNRGIKCDLRSLTWAPG